MTYNFNTCWKNIIFKLCHDSVAAIGLENNQGKFQLSKTGFGAGSYLTIVFDGTTDAGEEVSYCLPTLRPFWSSLYTGCSFDYDCEHDFVNYVWPIEDILRYVDARDVQYYYLPETAIPRLSATAYNNDYEDMWIKDVHVFMQHNTISFANIVVEVTDDSNLGMCTVPEFTEIYNDEVSSLDEMWQQTRWKRVQTPENENAVLGGGIYKISTLQDDWDLHPVVTFVKTSENECILGVDRDVVVNRRISSSPSLDLGTQLLIHNPAGDSISKGSLGQLLNQGVLQVLGTKH